MFKRELTFAVIAFILVIPITVFLSFTPSEYVFAAPPAKGWLKSQDCTYFPGTLGAEPDVQKCCWNEKNSEGKTVKKCQTCIADPQVTEGWSCDPVVSGISLPGDMPTLETVPPNRTLPGGGDLPTLQQGPGFNQQPEGEPPLPVVCSEEAGLVKDPETGQCVPIVQPPPSPPRGDDAEQTEEPQPEEPEEQSDQDDEQSSEDGDSSEGNNNGDSQSDN